MLPRAEFEQLVAAALDELPPFFHEKMSNVEVIIEAWPTREDLRAAGVPFGQTLLGLYQGVPLTQRGAHYQLTLPDRIAIFQGPIEHGLSNAGSDSARREAYGHPRTRPPFRHQRRSLAGVGRVLINRVS